MWSLYAPAIHQQDTQSLQEATQEFDRVPARHTDTLPAHAQMKIYVSRGAGGAAVPAAQAGQAGGASRCLPAGGSPRLRSTFSIKVGRPSPWGSPPCLVGGSHQPTRGWRTCCGASAAPATSPDAKQEKQWCRQRLAIGCVRQRLAMRALRARGPSTRPGLSAAADIQGMRQGRRSDRDRWRTRQKVLAAFQASKHLATFTSHSCPLN